MSNHNLHLSKDGIKLVQHYESCLKRTPDGRYKPYYCPAGVLTIGWGHTNHHGRKFTMADRWTRAECDEEFESDMELFERAVKRLVKVPLKQHQFDALVSFAYNCGEGALQRSTLLKKVNRKDFEGAAREFHKYNRGDGRVMSGLVRRRASESLMFQGFADKNFDGRADGRLRTFDNDEADLMPQAVDEPKPEKTMAQSKIGNAAAVVGTAGAAAAAEQATEQLDKLEQAGNVVSAWSWVADVATNPWFLVAVVIVIGAAYIWYDRRRKLREEGV
jgi:lysozyme